MKNIKNINKTFKDFDNDEIPQDVLNMSVVGETWKRVTDFENRFMISNYGRLISINGKRSGYVILKPVKGYGNYYLSTLRKVDESGKWIKRHARIHTLVAEHFLIKPNIKRPVVNHKDGNTTNNCVSNLEWTTHAENIKHAVRIGLFDKKGVKNHNHKLSESDVILARIMRNYGQRPYQKLADIFGIERRNMGDVVKGVTWAWLKDGLIENEQLSLDI